MRPNLDSNRNNCEEHEYAASQQLPPGLSAGLLVTARDATWRIVSWDTHEDCREVRLHGQFDERVLLWPFDRLEPIAEHRRARIVSKRRWARHVAALVRDRRHPAGLSVTATTAAILDYQLDPALAIASGATRVLLADEVGLGKTVQAGWIIADLLRREPAARVLVCTPAGLKSQWYDELRRFFHLDTLIADARWLRRRISDLPADINPWCLPGVYIASFDFIKRGDVTDPVMAEPWDLLVVDEAHGATAPTERHAALSSIARMCRRVVVVTATPFSGNVAAFESLRCMGAPRDANMLIFRRSRDDVGERRRRRHRFALIALDRPENQLQRALARYTKEVWQHSVECGAPRLAMTILRKRALSSPAALERSLHRRITLLDSRQPQPQQLALFDDDTDAEDDEPSAALGAPGLDDGEREKRWLSALATLAHAAAGVDAKRRLLARLLRRLRGTAAIVFTEYRDTLRDIARDYPAARQLHGGLTRQERDAVQHRFNEEGGLLLATDAAAEGLNLHGRCRLVVNYELPWNPARLEQRIGRVDRIGQRCPVHAISLVARDTAEDLVIANLLRRLDRVAQTLGARDRLAAFLHDTRIAQAVIGGTAIDAEACDEVSAATISAVSPDARRAAGDLKCVARLPAGSGRSEVPVCRLRCSRTLAAGTLFIIHWQALTRSGQVAACDAIPVHVARWRDPRDPSVLSAVAATARRHADGLLIAVARDQRQLCAALARRELELRGSPAASASQPGLFDRKVLDRHTELRNNAEACDELHRRRLATLGDAVDLTSDLHVAAVLLIDEGPR